MWLIQITGVVQGVGFRPSVKRAADRMGFRGFIRNDGSHVTIGVDMDVEGFLKGVKEELGPMARIEGVDSREMDWADLNMEEPSGFSITPSREGSMDSSLPPDTAMCRGCQGEMFDPDDRRYRFPFTNCTDCGARYTAIRSLPYDRERTTMEPFDLCTSCTDEYTDTTFRRFHAQTISCGKDGPAYVYLGRNMKEVSTGWDAFLDAAGEIKRGGKIIMKGWGGMHICCAPSELGRLRKWYGRPYKPFALMVRDLGTANSIVRLSVEGRRILSSPACPIVLMEKRPDAPGWARKGLDLASPGLGNVGIYLPYSGGHHLLFSALSEVGFAHPWVVMTSGNLPGEPMALTLDAISDLDADGYLVHNREIFARCDDSVVVPHPPAGSAACRPGPFDMLSFPIRKARGLIPDPLSIPYKGRVMALGAERNVSLSVTSGGRIFTSPYIGNTRHPSVMDYLRENNSRMRYLFGVGDIDAVGIDLHPRYNTGRYGSEIAKEEGADLVKVQHHHAHGTSLLVDAGLPSMGCVVVDGVGHGDDGKPWGGESLWVDYQGYVRASHLEPFGIPGGDASVYHPERIARWLCREVGWELTLGDERLESILEKTHKSSLMTSSMGRLLDGLSALLLGVTWRTYDGEPAIRLETLLGKSKNPGTEPFDHPISGSGIEVASRWRTLLEELWPDGGALSPGSAVESETLPDIAMGFVESIVGDLVVKGADEALAKGSLDGEGRPYVGITGGVSYNVPIVMGFLRSCDRIGARAVLHSRVPPGDGGISVGQAAVVASRL